MAATLFFFMTPEDERAFLRQIEPRAFEASPEIFDPSFEPIAVNADCQQELIESA